MPDRCIYISTLLSEEEKTQLHHVIQLNSDVFAWTHADMTGIIPLHASHRLNVGSRHARSHSLERGRIRLTAGNHLPLPLAGSIAIKQPHHSLPPLLLFQILRLIAIGRNPRHKVLPFRPWHVKPPGYPLPPDPHYLGGESGHLHR